MQPLRNLESEWSALRAREPRVRARDAARRLGVSEAELVASGCGNAVVRLRSDAQALFAALPALGRVIALTRNQAAVHERKGVYGPLTASGGVGQIVGEDIDLRLFFGRIAHAFAVRDGRTSLQLFDAAGEAVHKVFLEPESDLAAFERLVARFAAEDQTPRLVVTPAAAPPPSHAAVDVIELRTAWDAMQDTHQLHGLLRRYGLERIAALRLVGPERARQVPASALDGLLARAAAEALPIMVFVGSPGVIQIHTGPVHRIVETGTWINVLDETFNLHLDRARIGSAWLVRKPTSDGIVTSLELYDASGGTIALFFGRRKPGLPELLKWRHALEAVCAPA